MRRFDKPLRSIKSMKMVDRAMALADADAIGRRDCGRDPGLGMTHRLLQRLAFGEAGCNR